MTKIIKSLIILTSMTFIISCDDGAKNIDIKRSFQNQLIDYHESYLQMNPIAATSSGDDRYNDLFVNNISNENRSDTKTYYQSILDQLNESDRSVLDEEDQLSWDVLHWEASIALDELKYPMHLSPIDQMWSVNLYMGQLASGASSQPFKNEKDYRDWLKRVDGYLDWCNSAVENMKEGMSRGIVLPKPLIEKVIPQFSSLSGGSVEDHLFYRPIKNMPADIPENVSMELRSQYEDMVQNKIMPVYDKIAQFMEEEYLPKGRTSSGIGSYENGAEWYQHMIKKYTTTDMTADEIHQLGLSEVARLRSEMEKIKAQIGFEGDLKSFFDHVRNKKSLMPFTDPQEVIDNFNKIHEKMIPQLDRLFDLRPKADFEVRRTEKFRESSASAEYNPGSLDGSRPGIFYVPIPDVRKYNIYSDEDLFLHEAIPGHHYQISLQQENTSLPDFRKTLWYSAYGEGWALYCESLGKELGLYEDPYQYFGMLGAEMHRAIRLVVDTGIHSKGWSREKAIQYSLDNEAESEASIISEIERYMAMPGQALSYKIGQLKLLELRARAEKTLGDGFDIKQFHNIILESGCVPLKILEDRINHWIKK